MRNPPILSDEDAARQAAMSRHHASEIVRTHLDNHTAHNPGASSDYVTWIATLHPENADITVDQRFFIPGNPWWTIYEDAKNNNIPTATAVPVNDEEPHQEVGETQQTQSNLRTGEAGSPGSTKVESNSSAQPPHFCFVCSPVNLFFGFLVAFMALLSVFLCEFFALFLCYLPGALAYHTAKAFSPPNVCTGVFFSLFMVVHYSLALCDSIMLFTSVILTEVLACVGYVTSLITGGVLMSRYWHQQTRRTCHGVRVVFRKVSSDPPRQFGLWCTRNSEAMDSMTADPVPIAVHHATSSEEVTMDSMTADPVPIAVHHATSSEEVTMDSMTADPVAIAVHHATSSEEVTMSRKE